MMVSQIEDNGPWGFLRQDGSLGMPPAESRSAHEDTLLKWLQDNGLLQMSGNPSTIREATDVPVVTIGQTGRALSLVPEGNEVEPQDAPDALLLASQRPVAQVKAENVARQAQATADAQVLAEVEQAQKAREWQQPPNLSQMAQEATERFRVLNRVPGALARPRKPVMQSSRTPSSNQRIGPQRLPGSLLRQLR